MVLKIFSPALAFPGGASSNDAIFSLEQRDQEQQEKMITELSFLWSLRKFLRVSLTSLKNSVFPILMGLNGLKFSDYYLGSSLVLD